MANMEEKEEDKESGGREVVTGNEFSRRCQLRMGVARREDIMQGLGTLQLCSCSCMALLYYFYLIKCCNLFWYVWTLKHTQPHLDC